MQIFEVAWGAVIISSVIQRIKNLYHGFSALLANVWYRWPSRKLRVVGVTGTDGKTTTVTLIDHILSVAGKKSGFISTVEAKIDNQKIPGGLHTTTPDPWQLQRLVKLAVDRGLEFLVLEASSHGLDQHRLAGINFQVGVLTNVTREHLDYHRTYQRYLQAKAKLFKRSKIVVLNKDDDSYSLLVKHYKLRVKSYAIKKQADFTPKNFKFTTKLPGEYNQYNCLAAIATCSALGIDKKLIQEAVASFKGVKGRMEEVEAGQPFRIFVDFAHTPNGLRQVLQATRPLVAKQGRLIVVFGSAGRRDVGKRPLMGQVAGELADEIILTADDSRDEPTERIIDQIAQGTSKKVQKIPDRRQAIQAALKMAKNGDVVLLCGKGHERSLTIGNQELPWDEKKTVLEIWQKISRSMVS